MEKDRGKYGMRVGMREGGVGAFIRKQDQKVIDRELKHALSRAVELAMATSRPGEVPDIPDRILAEIMESTLNRLAADGKITPLLEGKKYRVNESLQVAVVRDPDYVWPTEAEEQ